MLNKISVCENKGSHLYRHFNNHTPTYMRALNKRTPTETLTYSTLPHTLPLHTPTHPHRHTPPSPHRPSQKHTHILYTPTHPPPRHTNTPTHTHPSTSTPHTHPPPAQTHAHTHAHKTNKPGPTQLDVVITWLGRHEVRTVMADNE